MIIFMPIRKKEKIYKLMNIFQKSNALVYLVMTNILCAEMRQADQCLYM